MDQDTQTVERDAIAVALQKLRADYGAISYRDITRRIADSRRAAGLSPAEARVPFTTVYDLFNTDRKRKNPSLISEAVFAITGDHALAENWLARAGNVAAGLGELDEDDAPAVNEEAVADDADDAGTPLIAEVPAVEEVAAINETIVVDDPEFPSVAEPSPDGVSKPRIPLDDDPFAAVAEPSEKALGGSLFSRISYPQVLLFFGCIALNVLLDQFRQHILQGYVPLFLDMIGTAIAAFTLGPWAAVAVGILSNVANSVLDPTARGFGLWSWFVLVQIAGALIWGYGYRWAKSIPTRLVYITVLVAVVSSLIAFTIIEVSFNGYMAHSGGSLLVSTLETPGEPTHGLIFQVNLIISLIDKTLATVLALLMAPPVFRSLQRSKLKMATPK